jgi:hypothetical protein
MRCVAPSTRSTASPAPPSDQAAHTRPAVSAGSTGRPRASMANCSARTLLTQTADRTWVLSRSAFPAAAMKRVCGVLTASSTTRFLHVLERVGRTSSPACTRWGAQRGTAGVGFEPTGRFGRPTVFKTLTNCHICRAFQTRAPVCAPFRGRLLPSAAILGSERWRSSRLTVSRFDCALG